ncbi:MAG: hypothetical protein LBJ13_03680 [Puniceicoccales bacterium]|jgi:hypothetical protein|nr:hypothetical protein [Puniceicoccales bacterium]
MTVKTLTITLLTIHLSALAAIEQGSTDIRLHASARAGDKTSTKTKTNIKTVFLTLGMSSNEAEQLTTLALQATPNSPLGKLAQTLNNEGESLTKKPKSFKSKHKPQIPDQEKRIYQTVMDQLFILAKDFENSDGQLTDIPTAETSGKDIPEANFLKELPAAVIAEINHRKWTAKTNKQRDDQTIKILTDRFNSTYRWEGRLAQDAKIIATTLVRAPHGSELKELAELIAKVTDPDHIIKEDQEQNQDQQALQSKLIEVAFKIGKEINATKSWEEAQEISNSPIIKLLQVLAPDASAMLTKLTKQRQEFFGRTYTGN